MGAFTGFTQAGLTFLQELRQNNDKEWFEEHRDIYQQHLLEPMRKLVEDLSQDMVVIDDLFEVRPAKVRRYPECTGIRAFLTTSRFTAVTSG